MILFIGIIIGFFGFRCLAPAIGFQVSAIKDLAEERAALQQRLQIEYDQRLYLEVLKETLKERLRSLEQMRERLKDTNEMEYQKVGDMIQGIENRVKALEPMEIKNNSKGI